LIGAPTLEGDGATVTSTSVDPSPTLPPDPAKATYAITFGGSGGRLLVVVVVLDVALPLHAARAAAAAVRRTALVVLADRGWVGTEARCSVIADRS
jgi:hypothetical protein